MRSNTYSSPVAARRVSRPVISSRLTPCPRARYYTHNGTSCAVMVIKEGAWPSNARLRRRNPI